MNDERFIGEDAKSSAAILAALKKAEDAFRDWHSTCTSIDEIYNLSDSFDFASYGWQDATLDLFWSSFEVLKPAIYARPPQPVVAPLFKDGKALENTTAELLERCAISTFQRTDMNDVMIHLRDDLLFAGRGTPWVRYDHEDGNHEVCVEHKDRLDFLHEPARKWSEVGWVAGAAWLTKADMEKRFPKADLDDVTYSQERSDSRDMEKRATVQKAKIWEVWHKADGKVYWVTDGVSELLDSADPDVTLRGFFPCPRPAYATLRRRSLIPVPDWQRYAIHFRKISELTRRIYSLLDKVRMKGLIPAGGDIGDAVETLIRDDSDEILIPVPGAAMMAQGTGFVAWLPLTELATAIQGLIDARTQLVNDFFQLSGISDIMRGATEAGETLGAQQLKSQYGSVRVREKSSELQRVAADCVGIAAEIIAQKFPADTLLEMSGLEILKKSEIQKRVDEIEKSAKQEMAALGDKARQAAEQAEQPGQDGQPQQVDPDHAQQALQQAQQQIIAKYAPMLAEAQRHVPLEDVMKLLRDDRTRSFVFEIESSSTILTDEIAEKDSRNEFMGKFTEASQALMGLSGMGEQGAKLAGSLMKFVLAPYRAGRDLDGAIDEFIDAAPAMAAAAAGKQDGNEGMAEAEKAMAEAEKMKAQAAMMNVQAKSARDQAENQRKIAEMQQDAQDMQAKFAESSSQHGIDLAKAQGDLDKQRAEINNLEAQTALLLDKVGLDVRKQHLAEYTAADASQHKVEDRAMAMDKAATDAAFRMRGEDRADMVQNTDQGVE